MCVIVGVAELVSDRIEEVVTPLRTKERHIREMCAPGKDTSQNFKNALVSEAKRRHIAPIG